MVHYGKLYPLSFGLAWGVVAGLGVGLIVLGCIVFEAGEIIFLFFWNRYRHRRQQEPSTKPLLEQAQINSTAGTKEDEDEETNVSIAKKA